MNDEVQLGEFEENMSGFGRDWVVACKKVVFIGPPFPRTPKTDCFLISGRWFSPILLAFFNFILSSSYFLLLYFFSFLSFLCSPSSPYLFFFFFCNLDVVPQGQCTSVCNTFVQYCSSLLNLTGSGSLIPDCSLVVQPDPCQSEAFSPDLPAGEESGFFFFDLLIFFFLFLNFLSWQVLSVPPLILNPTPSVANPNCVGYCCVPCPQTHYFYTEGLVDSIDRVGACCSKRKQ